MAFGIYFVDKGFTRRITAVRRELEAAGAAKPKGQHLPLRTRIGRMFQVFDICESQADFDAFGPTLMPILAELDVGLKEPMVARSTTDNDESLGTDRSVGRFIGPDGRRSRRIPGVRCSQSTRIGRRRGCPLPRSDSASPTANQDPSSPTVEGVQRREERAMTTENIAILNTGHHRLDRAVPTSLALRTRPTTCAIVHFSVFHQAVAETSGRGEEVDFGRWAIVTFTSASAVFWGVPWQSDGIKQIRFREGAEALDLGVGPEHGRRASNEDGRLLRGPVVEAARLCAAVDSRQESLGDGTSCGPWPVGAIVAECRSLGALDPEGPARPRSRRWRGPSGSQCRRLQGLPVPIRWPVRLAVQPNIGVLGRAGGGG